MKKKLTIVLLSLLALVSLVVFLTSLDSDPEYFPFKNPDAEYRVTKFCPAGQGTLAETKYLPPSVGYCIEYTDLTNQGSNDGSKIPFFRITVGKSSLDLSKIEGGLIRILDAKFTSSSQQCIQDSCIDIGGPFLVLDINNAEIIN